MSALRDHFNGDYNYALSAHRPKQFGYKDSPVKFEAIERLHLDFRSNAKFVSYFLPKVEKPLDLCKLILKDIQTPLSMSDGVVVVAGYPGQRTQTNSDLVFTKHIVFYIDMRIEPEIAGEIEAAATEMGLFAIVRGQQYAVLRDSLRLTAIEETVESGEGLAVLEKRIKALDSLLNDAKREEEAHQFLKDNPSVLGLTSVTDPISKFPLGSDFVTDFVVNEVPYGYVLVEIEKVGTKLFKKSQQGRPPERTQELNHAIEQVEQWRSWVGRNHSYISEKLKTISPNPLCWVIAGRSNELSEKEKKQIIQFNEQRQGCIVLFTYDDLLARLTAVLHSLTEKAKAKET